VTLSILIPDLVQSQLLTLHFDNLFVLARTHEIMCDHEYSLSVDSVHSRPLHDKTQMT
jgi:hypothetical protein